MGWYKNWLDNLKPSIVDGKFVLLDIEHQKTYGLEIIQDIQYALTLEEANVLVNKVDEISCKKMCDDKIRGKW